MTSFFHVSLTRKFRKMGLNRFHWVLLLLSFTQCQCNKEEQPALPYRSKTLSQYASPPRPLKPLNSGPCGGTKFVEQGEHGFIESPGYPFAYPAGIECEWKLETTPDVQIQATLFDVRTQNNLFADISDSLFMSLAGTWNNSQRYSGDFNPVNPLVLLSEGNTLLIRFRSSSFSTGSKGFRLGYYVTKGCYQGCATSGPNKPSASEPAHDVHTVVVCNYVPVDYPQIFPECGISRDKDEQLDGLNRTNPNPFLVALVLDDQQFCSGTLVSERHIITSAHCTRGVRRFEMIFGSADLSVEDAGVQKRFADASDITSHPFFDASSGANDISVITLRQNVTFTRFVFPAELPNWRFLGETLSGSRATTVGWGDTRKGTVYSQAAESDAYIEPNSLCRAYNRASSGLTMCSRKRAASLCQGDSGSPVFTRSASCDGDGCPTADGSGQGSYEKPPHKPQKPTKPKPGKPSKPSRPHNREDEENRNDNGKGNSPVSRPLLLGVLSHGSCDRGFSITRVTGYLDFLSETMGNVN